MAFGRPNEIRTVFVPEDEYSRAQSTDEILNLVFQYGQNDVQPQKHPSVSVGDVIELEGTYWLVKGVGFKKMTPQELEEYLKIPPRERSMAARLDKV